MKLLYIANIRLPTEKAHGLQIVQNCEAFAEAGAEVTLWTAARWNTAALRDVADVWAHYGVTSVFAIRRLPCLDLLPLVPGQTHVLARAIFYLQALTFLIAALLRLAVVKADVIYSRDALVLVACSLFQPRRKLVYEAHKLASGQGGRWLQRQVVQRAGTVVCVTARLRADLIALGADPARALTAHDGIRAGRFSNMPDQAVAREALGWPRDAFIVGYVGRLQTLGMDKGVGLLIGALRTVEGVTLALVGGPDAQAEAFRAQWVESGLAGERFLNAGQVAPEQVPLTLSALDVCAMPFPWTEHFAYYASPMKLFEYMASGRPIVASDLPSTTEVVHDGESALLYPPGDAAALAAAVARLQAEPILRERLAARAQALVMEHYTWSARAAAILAHIARGREL